MRQRFVKLKNQMLRCGSKKNLQESAEIIIEENYRALRAFSILSFAMLSLLAIYSLFLTPLGRLSSLYVSFAALSAVNLIILLIFTRLHKSRVSAHFYACFGMLFVFFLILDVIMKPNLPASMFLIIILLAPIVFLDYTSRMILVLAAAAAGFCTATLIYKPDPAIYSIDIINAICCLVLSIFTKITITRARLENISTRRMLKEQSTTDDLTGLPNRRSFNEYIYNLSKSTNSSELSVYAIMLDIDNFKLYNDLYGHIMGDECLRNIANALKEASQKNNMSVFRFGGEEFIAISINSSVPIDEIGNSLVLSVSDEKIPHPGSILDIVTISAGCAKINATDQVSLRELVGMADRALYAAKKSGKNCCVVFDEQAMSVIKG